MLSDRGRPELGPIRGGALYVGALVGPGILIVPALAVQAAGAASIVAWCGLLVLSAPLAITFAALGVRHPVAGGVSTYVQEGLGDAAATITGVWFLTAIFLGAPAVSLVGGYYVADIVGGGSNLARVVSVAIFATVLASNAVGLRLAAGLQLLLSSCLLTVLIVAVTAALPAHATDHWQPFAAHGWWSIATAASLLVWLFIGWEAVAQLAGEFRRPAVDLPRAVAIAFALVSLLYLGVAVATIGVSANTSSRVPLADLVAVVFGRAGRDAAAVLAIALTMGTMNVYLAAAAKLIGALASEGKLPPALAVGSDRPIPRRPLIVIAALVSPAFATVLCGVAGTEFFIRATSACFVSVYLLATLSAARILEQRARLCAAISFALVLVLACLSTWFLVVPVTAAALCLAVGRPNSTRAAKLTSPSASTTVASDEIAESVIAKTQGGSQEDTAAAIP